MATDHELSRGYSKYSESCYRILAFILALMKFIIVMKMQVLQVYIRLSSNLVIRSMQYHTSRSIHIQDNTYRVLQ